MLAPVLSLVPFAVLYGVFLYMGMSGIGGIQMFDRLFLLLVPVKHHPSVGYARRVSSIATNIIKVLHISFIVLKIIYYRFLVYSFLFVGKNMENAFVYDYPVFWTWSIMGCKGKSSSIGVSFLRCFNDSPSLELEIHIYRKRVRSCKKKYTVV